MGNKITVIGSSNADMIIKTPRIPKPGETILGGKFMKAHGGKGANQAVAAVRAGGNVTFIACLGDDSIGMEALKTFESEGLNTSFIYRDPSQPSGVAMIFVSDSGENSIAVAPGANNSLLPEIFSEEAVLEIASSEILLMQLEIPLETVQYAVDIAYSQNVKAILNPAPAQNLPDDILKKIYLITPNETETELLTGIRPGNFDECQKAALLLRNKGVENVIITLGSHGAYISSAEYDEIIPAFPVKPVDTTAAGDVFNGALAVALVEKKTLPDAVKFASSAAAYSVTKLGAQPSAPYRKSINDILYQS